MTGQFVTHIAARCKEFPQVYSDLYKKEKKHRGIYYVDVLSIRGGGGFNCSSVKVGSPGPEK